MRTSILAAALMAHGMRFSRNKQPLEQADRIPNYKIFSVHLHSIFR